MTELAYPSGLSNSSGCIALSAIRERLAPRQVHAFRDLAVEGLSFHSAEVRAGDLFFAIRGTHHDGAHYAAQALARGAVAVVAEELLRLSCPVMVVPNARRALADAACFYYGYPSRTVPVIGVTGTNGKTTVAHLIRDCLVANRRSTGLLGTIGYEFAGRHLPATNTTPDALRMQGYLREMADRGCRACVAEISSHALMQERVRGVEFDAGVFTNLSQDHLDYHGSMREYARAKARLFRQIRPGGHACVSLDSPAAETMLSAIEPGVNVHTFGFSRDADLRAENLHCTLEGTRFEMVMPHGRVDLLLRLPGEHNVQNALAAASAAVAVGVSELTIAGALEEARPVRGRLELVGYRNGVRTFVDYAHTPDALDKVCSILHRLTEGRLHVVFGCGGDRDKSKRPMMAGAVARYADFAWMTSDNPRSEDPELILDHTEEGIGEIRGRWFRVVDRAEAIHRAIATAEPGDTVLIAGKGHETYQILRDSVVPFDDRLVAREALQLRGQAR